MKRVLCCLTALCLLAGLLTFTGCAPKNGTADLKTDALPCIHEPEFGGVYIQMTIDAFNALGFAYGDSVNVSFSNGYHLDDLPYYNGYYVLTGEPLLVAYPGYDYIKAAINNGDDLWTVAELDDDTTAEISLCARGKYLNVQQARDIHYEDDRALFASDAVFANFRNVQVGQLKENVLYRSASPCDNQHNRAPYVGDLIEQAGVRFIVNLSDTDEKIAKYIAADDFDSPYFLSLYENGQVIPLSLNMNFGSDAFREKVVHGLAAMAENDGPYLVHCTEGKDRTGFFCILLETLAGATYQEIVDDYMVTFDNYYGITENTDKVKYDTIVESLFLPMLRTIVGEDADLSDPGVTLSGNAEQYLRDAGMPDEQIAALHVKLVG
jgi:hypothetical protein